MGTHSLPTGLYHIQYDGKSEQYFSQNVLCMKENVQRDFNIELPRDTPFYLMRFKSHCQAVYGTFFTEVSLTWLTETNHKTKWEGADSGVETYDKMFIPLEMNSWGRAQAYGRRDQIPDGHYGQDYIQIWYCYYQPTVIYIRLDEGEDGPDPWWILNDTTAWWYWKNRSELTDGEYDYAVPEVMRRNLSVSNLYRNVDIKLMSERGVYDVDQ